MKTIFTLITLFIYSSFYSQNFQETTEYSLTDYSTIINSNKVDDNKVFEVYLTKNDEVLSKITNFTYDNLDTFLDVKVETLENPNLDYIQSVVKVTFEFFDSCLLYESHYFLVTNENLLVELPELSYMHCEYATEKVEYIFPNQQFGKENIILQSLSFLDENKETESIEIERTIIWEEEFNTEYYTSN